MVKMPSLLEIRARNPAGERRLWLIGLGIWLATLLAAGAVGAWIAQATTDGNVHARVKSLAAENDAFKDQVAVLKRSEQVARTAVADLQQSLGDREEEIDGLRADLAFYGRLVGGEKREGLAVHGIRLTPVPGSRAWNFVATLTQNFKRGQDTRGRLTLAVTGVRAGKLAALDWEALTEHEHAPGLEFAFKYFQQIRGTIMFPEGFDPNRIRVRAEGDWGHVEQDFPWEDAISHEETNDVRQ
jgi:hypothetical protein